MIIFTQLFKENLGINNGIINKTVQVRIYITGILLLFKTIHLQSSLALRSEHHLITYILKTLRDTLLYKANNEIFNI